MRRGVRWPSGEGPAVLPLSIHWRGRGAERFKPFTAGDYESLRLEFVAAERVDLLDR